MSGLRLQKELKQLADRYGYVPSPTKVNLGPPTNHPLTLCGIASTSDVDHERVSFAPRCFDLTAKLPPLFYDHDEDQPAGHVEELHYDDLGRLCTRVTVTHSQARRCGAFSVAAHIDEYEIKNKDTYHFHAVVRRARLGDISLVETPINPKALVKTRWAAMPISPASSQFYDLIIRRVELLGKFTKSMQQGVTT